MEQENSGITAEMQPSQPNTETGLTQAEVDARVEAGQVNVAVDPPTKPYPKSF